MESSQYDIVIIGGGILGLSTAMQLLERSPQWRVAVVEKEEELATHQTGTVTIACLPTAAFYFLPSVSMLASHISSSNKSSYFKPRILTEYFSYFSHLCCCF